jgi:hypothetical protein
MNAGRSTGPKTQESKARSSNSITLGFYSDVAVLPGEDPAAYNALREELAEHYQPVGPVEAELTERVALALWKLRRLEGIETRLLSVAGKTRPTSPPPTGSPSCARVLTAPPARSRKRASPNRGGARQR